MRELLDAWKIDEGTVDSSLNEAPQDWIMLELACDPDVVGSWDRYTIASVCQKALKALRDGRPGKR